jgi:hypothetical protein
MKLTSLKTEESFSILDNLLNTFTSPSIPSIEEDVKDLSGLASTVKVSKASWGNFMKDNIHPVK